MIKGQTKKLMLVVLLTVLCVSVGGGQVFAHGHHMEIAEFEVIDRSADDVTAYVHHDHWHGELPNVPVNEDISLGAYIEDEHGDEIELGSEYELRARLADGAAEGIVEFHSHGDHVHVVGESEGETDIVFELWHGDHVDYETPEITVQVGDDERGFFSRIFNF
ncbi:hypothetical protein MWH25_01695 [Natroniella acetigena]|uniref:hypothetical protein n=1 Tax=Natroniella acetigena TaxID=52004 RepID=UPI00200AED75|nr:hypothetical protein [Natroniella acetigena]MCK8826462.1 hypothetical protein [Natroniella acetigena]